MAILFKTAYDSTEGKEKKRDTLALVQDWMPGLTNQQMQYLKGNYWKG